METKIKDRISSLSDDEKNRLSGIRCGSYRIAKEDIIRTTNIDFSAFLSSRHSIRDFKEGLISEENIIKAIEMANKCPSACNRQPIKVYCTNTIDKSKEVDKLITGTNGFQGIIQNFMIITVDRAYFSGAEYNQWYINGGIFVSSLIMALHSLNIGSCVMQWRQFYKNERKLKSLLGIKKQDAIITIVGIGYYPDSVKVISAQRRDVEDMISFIK